MARSRAWKHPENELLGKMCWSSSIRDAVAYLVMTNESLFQIYRHFVRSFHFDMWHDRLSGQPNPSLDSEPAKLEWGGMISATRASLQVAPYSAADGAQNHQDDPLPSFSGPVGRYPITDTVHSL